MALSYLFINYKNGAECLSQLAQFRDDIYTPAFPDENEREPFDENILPRLQTKGDILQTAIVLAYDGDQMVGGMLTDWYPSCSSLEIIYMAVAEDFRGKSLGHQILKEATAIVCESIEEDGVPVEYIFFETENPAVTKDAPIDTEARLRFFAAAGAALIPFSYAQPPLSAEQDWARNLYLCVLPFEKEENDFIIGETETTGIPVAAVMDFLHDFYTGLGYAEKGADELEKSAVSLKSLQNEDGEVPLIFFENPRFKLYDVAIASYYQTDTDEDEEISIPETACPVFNSYECDLMNYRHQSWEDRPFTNHHRLLLENVAVLFPASYHYSSEGNTFYHRTSRRRIMTDISINSSYKHNEGSIPLMNHLLHLVLRPAKNDNGFLTELDMLKFVVCFGFGSKQENVCFDNMLDESGFQIDTTGCENLPQHLRKVFSSFEELLQSALDVEGCKPLGTGVSELELSAIEGPLSFNTFEEFRQDILSEGPQNNDWNKTLCGLVLGIFDFERMNGPEIYDTIRPVLDRKYAFALLCRGHLVHVKMDLEPERVETILMSPYLLIPGAALAFNEDVIVRNWTLLEQMSRLEDDFRKSVSKGERKKKHRVKIKNELFFNDFYNQSNELAQCISEVSESLTGDYLEDIFQYPSEKALLNAGSEQRGLSARREDMMEMLENYKEKVVAYREKYTDNVDTIQNILLFILAVMQVITAVMQEEVLWITTSVIIVLVCAFGIRQIRRKRKM